MFSGFAFFVRWCPRIEIGVWYRSASATVSLRRHGSASVAVVCLRRETVARNACSKTHNLLWGQRHIICPRIEIGVWYRSASATVSLRRHGSASVAVVCLRRETVARNACSETHNLLWGHRHMVCPRIEIGVWYRSASATVSLRRHGSASVAVVCLRRETVARNACSETHNLLWGHRHMVCPRIEIGVWYRSASATVSLRRHGSASVAVVCLRRETVARNACSETHNLLWGHRHMVCPRIEIGVWYRSASATVSLRRHDA